MNEQSMQEYTDRLSEMSLEELRMEAQLWSPKDKVIKRLILKHLVSNFKQEISMRTIKIDDQKIQSQMIRDLNGRYLFINTSL